MTATELPGRVDLTEQGIDATGAVYRNPTTALLYTHALARGEGKLAEGGPLVVDTGSFTGRSPKDKFLVDEPSSDRSHLVGRRQPEALRGSLRAAAREGRVAPRSLRSALRRRRLGGSRPRASDRRARDHGAPVPRALRSHDVHRSPPRRAGSFAPQAVVLHTPDLEADPEEDGTRTGTFVVLHPGRTELLVGGTYYAGEIKKSIFTVMNDRLPLEGVFPMHCSANVDDARPRRDLLRAVGHGQDDALRRRRAIADRRRRAWLGRQRRLQHRRRLLREGDPPVAGRRAGDLSHDSHVRDDPRERRDRRVRPPRSRRRLEDREHARRVQAGADRSRSATRSRPATRVR